MGNKGNWYTLGRDIQKILTNQETIMSKIDDVNAKLAEVKDLVAQDEANEEAGDAADAATIADRNARIAELEQQIADGATGAQLDAINNELDAIKASIRPSV